MRSARSSIEHRLNKSHLYVRLKPQQEVRCKDSMPEDAIDRSYVWLRIQFDDKGNPIMESIDEWSLAVFE
jgi:hypothetical protein